MEQIYTIPINEVFDRGREDASCGCPICLLRERLEENELDLILGASMMEPDIRIKTNEQGFCRRHYGGMIKMKNRLGLALMLESHLAEVQKGLKDSLLSTLIGKKREAPVRRIEKMESSCYICGKVDYHLTRTVDNLTELYLTDEDFREKYAAQTYFCLPHARAMLDIAKRNMSGKEYAAFCDVTLAIERAYLDKLSGDVSWFCKKFDYRYDAEPWYDSKDAIERAAAFLTGRQKD